MIGSKQESGNPTLWFADFDGQYLNENVDFLPKENEPICHELERLYPEILQEVSFLWTNHGSRENPFNNYNSFDDKQFPAGSWKKIVLKVWGLTARKNVIKFPIIHSLLAKNHQRITSCQITRLAPGSVIKPHCGETNSILRLHLGLNVPDKPVEECGIRVGVTKRRWKNGEVLCFLDAIDHDVWNNSESYRYILIVDVLRPEFQHSANLICSHIIVSQAVFMLLIKLRLRNLAQLLPSTFFSFLAHLFRYPVSLLSYTLNYRIKDA